MGQLDQRRKHKDKEKVEASSHSPHSLKAWNIGMLLFLISILYSFQGLRRVESLRKWIGISQNLIFQDYACYKQVYDIRIYTGI